MGKSSAPSAPDPQASADAQIRVNQSTIDQLQHANNSNQVNPLGSLTWTQDPTTGQWTQTQSLAPPIQDQLNQQIVNQDLGLGTAGNAMARLLNSNYAGGQLNLSGLPQAYGGNDLPRDQLVAGIDTGILPSLQTSVSGAADPAALKQQQDAVYNQMTSRLDPQWNQQQEQFEAQLADQGIPQNSEAWNRAMDDFTRQRTDAYQSANNAAVDAGNQLQQQLFGQGLAAGQFTNSAQNQAYQQLLSKAGFANSATGQDFSQALQQGQFGDQARQQALQELLTQRQEPINEIMSLQGGGNVMQPQFGQTNQISGPNGAPNMAQLFGQQYAGQLNAYNANVGQQNQILGSAGQLLMSALPFLL